MSLNAVRRRTIRAPWASLEAAPKLWRQRSLKSWGYLPRYGNCGLGAWYLNVRRILPSGLGVFAVFVPRERRCPAPGCSSLTSFSASLCHQLSSNVLAKPTKAALRQTSWREPVQSFHARCTDRYCCFVMRNCALTPRQHHKHAFSHEPPRRSNPQIALSR